MQLYAYSRGAVGRNLLLALPTLRNSVSAAVAICVGLVLLFPPLGFSLSYSAERELLSELLLALSALKL